MPARIASCGVVLVVEPVQDLRDFTGEGDGSAGVVDPGHHQSAGGQQPVVLHAADLFDAVPFGGGVEGLDQRVEHRHRCSGGQRTGELVEAQQLGVDHRDVAVLGADVLLALAVATGLRFGHQAGQQFVVLAPLLVDELLLGLQAGAHGVERR